MRRDRRDRRAAADVDLGIYFAVVPVTDGPELATKYVDPQWLEGSTGEKPDPERPLSSVKYLFLWAELPAGHLSAQVSLATVEDQVAEPAESVRFQLTDEFGEPQPGGPVLSGTVLDAS